MSVQNLKLEFSVQLNYQTRMTIELKCFQKWNGSETLPSTNSFQEVTFGGHI